MVILKSPDAHAENRSIRLVRVERGPWQRSSPTSSHTESSPGPANRRTPCPTPIKESCGQPAEVFKREIFFHFFIFLPSWLALPADCGDYPFFSSSFFPKPSAPVPVLSWRRALAGRPARFGHATISIRPPWLAWLARHRPAMSRVLRRLGRGLGSFGDRRRRSKFSVTDGGRLSKTSHAPRGASPP